MMQINNFFKKHHWLIHSCLVLLFFSIIYILFFSPVLFSEILLAPGDGIAYYLPAFYSVRTLWTDLILSGFPVAADPQVETWYPVSLILSLIPHSWNAFVISAYVLASSFTYGYVYSLSNSKLAGLVSGIVYGMSGFMMAHLGHTTIIHAAAWMPLLIWATHRLRECLSPMWLLVGTFAVTCSILAGHPQISIYGIGVSVAYAILLGWSLPLVRWKYYGAYLAVIILGVSLAAIQIIPTAELGGLGLRTKMTFEEFVSYSLPLWQSPQLLFPYLFGAAGNFYQPPYFGTWNLTEVAGYVGLLPLLLAVIGFLTYRHKSIAWFWISVAMLTFLLALGSTTPLAQIFYHLPVYNKFRAQARHFIEMALAVSVLAGLGVAALQQQLASKRLLLKIISVSTGIIIINLVGIFVFSAQLQSRAATKVGLQNLSFLPWTNPAVGIPLVIFLLSVAVLTYFSNSKQSRFSALLLLVVLLIDLGSFGWFYEWRNNVYSNNILTPTVTTKRYREVLKESKQRLLSTSGGVGNFDEIPPNISRLFAVPNASGYGPMILSRYSELFPIGSGGEVSGEWAFAKNRSLDIMSVRYIFMPPTEQAVQIDEVNSKKGILWAAEDMSVAIGSECLTTESKSVKFKVPSQPKATAIGIVSSLGCSTKLLNNAEVLRISVTDTTEKTVTQSMQAGRDTAEWAYECSDVLPMMQHQKASIFSSATHSRKAPFKDCQIHSYVTVLPLDPINNVQDIALDWVGSSGVINIQKISLIDESIGQSYPITETTTALADTSRWKYVEHIQGQPIYNQNYLGSYVYENLRAMPRAWLVPEVVTAKKDEVLRAIHSSQLPDGRPFDPSQIALVEKPLNFKVQKLDAAATTKVINLSDTQLEVKISSKSPAFLVLSDVYYPGWQAKIDGVKAKIFQTNYVLRGVQVPAGMHTVQFEFKPVSFHIGVGISAASLVLLGYLVWRLQQKPKALMSNGS